ncbi:MAG: hypothetical protein ACPGJS_01250 [Flammeovirgaceae bacterium]
MTKIKVNINKEDSSPETIRKYKSYDNFITSYQKLHTPRGIHELWTKDRVKFSMIVVFLVLLLLYVFGELGDEAPRQQTPEEQKIEESVEPKQKVNK